MDIDLLLIFYDLADCPVGYYGRQCSRSCRYPSYGINCQQDCSECGQEACSVIFGCMTSGKQTQSGTIMILQIHWLPIHSSLSLYWTILE